MVLRASSMMSASLSRLNKTGAPCLGTNSKLRAIRIFCLSSNGLATCHGKRRRAIVRNVVGDHVVAFTRSASVRSQKGRTRHRVPPHRSRSKLKPIGGVMTEADTTDRYYKQSGTVDASRHHSRLIAVLR